MENIKLNSEKKTDLRGKTIFIVSLALGIVFPLGSWILDIYSHNYAFSFNSLIVIHKNNVLHLVIDTAPFVLGGLGYYLSKTIDAQAISSRHLFRKQEKNFRALASFAENISTGNYNSELDVESNDNLAKVLYEMRDSLRNNTLSEQKRNYIMRGVAEISGILREFTDIDELSFEVIKFITNYLGAVQGAFYILEEDNNSKILKMRARYAYNRKKFEMNEFRIGQGLIGQCAFEKQIIHRTEIPNDYATLTSGLIKDKKPDSILIAPLVTNDTLYGVIEFASIEKFNDQHLLFLQEIGDIIARTIFNINTNETTKRLLEESQLMSKELQEQQEILTRNALDMKAAQEMLEESNTKLESQIQIVENQQKRQHALLTKSSEIITIYDKEGIITYQSPSVENILGYDPDEMLGENDFYRMNPAGEKAVKSMFDEILQNPEKQLVVEYMYIKKDGDKVWLESTARNLIQDPAIHGIVFNSRDITLRRKAEKEEAMRGKMQALSENSQDIITRVDLEGKFLYVNPRLSFFTGLNKAKVEASTIQQIDLDEKIKDGWNSVIAEAKKQQKIISKEIEFPTMIDDMIMQVNAIPEYDKNNNLETILLVSHDITQRKKQELIIQETNRKITDSINYAKRIQHAIIPIREEIAQNFNDFLMYYKPKDVVSGDFPWYYKKGNLIYVAAVDCTGHGVPGAMMSLIGFLLLNDIVNDSKDLSPSEILDALNDGVVNTLKQNAEGNKAADGMDVALCRIDLTKKELQYAGAHRPLYFISKGELEQFKGDKFPIGGKQYKGEAKFTNHTIKFSKGDSVFFFSDGLPDQFGGPENFKYGPARIRENIMNNLHLSMGELEQVFDQDLNDWMKNTHQFDDVLFMGIRF